MPKLSAGSKENYRLSETLRQSSEDTKAEKPRIDPPPNCPAHYLVPGTDIQLIDVIKSKMTLAEWRKFCWGSAAQYVFRILDKGEPGKDIGKAKVYLNWLEESL